MEHAFDRLPALPLITNDPYFSVWLPADLPTQATTVHWSGVEKPIFGFLTVDGKRCQFMGKSGLKTVLTTAIRVTPTRTFFSFTESGVRLDVTFWTPALPDNLDVLSTPITFVDYEICAVDGGKHDVCVELQVTDTLCYDGGQIPAMGSYVFHNDALNVCCVGRKQQNILCHSGDRITIDWGYLYIASQHQVRHQGESTFAMWETVADIAPKRSYVLLGYDDVASINYFGVPCRAWYGRNGMTFMEALQHFAKQHNELLQQCIDLDNQVLADAKQVGGEDYQLIVSAAWRQIFAAHKLIASPKGELVLLSKENDSCGCVGTVDVSYPSIPIFLKYCPELVNALCRPIMEFASMPVWKYDFSPHDVGRYPYVTGQFYALREMPLSGEVVPPIYQFPENEDLYDPYRQMPLEESSNMIIMLEAAMSFGADKSLSEKYLPILERWAQYLDLHGEDPEDQLCTDDFAGHLAHNVNLAAKAIIGMKCYARILERFGKSDAYVWHQKAQLAADRWLERTASPSGTPLTFDGSGWSMKYNLVWDRVLGLDLFPSTFYETEIASYLNRQNEFGLPLDCRADYTKSDWLCWVAAMAEPESRAVLIAPLAKYLRTTTTRVPFGDWYDSVTGQYITFIARSVQGGVFMPILAQTELRQKI